MSGTVISPLQIFQEGISHLGKGKTIGTRRRRGLRNVRGDEGGDTAEKSQKKTEGGDKSDQDDSLSPLVLCCGNIFGQSKGLQQFIVAGVFPTGGWILTVTSSFVGDTRHCVIFMG